METEKIEIQKRLEEMAEHLLKGEAPRTFKDAFMAKWSIGEWTFYDNIGTVRRALNAGEYKTKYLEEMAKQEDAAAEKKLKLKSLLDIKVLLHSFLDGTFKEEVFMYTKDGITKMEKKPAIASMLKTIDKILVLLEKESINNVKDKDDKFTPGNGGIRRMEHHSGDETQKTAA
jgi:hypothetical protein